MTVGEKIKLRREELNMSQDELAKKVGYKSRSSIQKIEASRDLPLKKVEKMAKVLDLNVSYLMGWSDDDKVECRQNYRDLMSEARSLYPEVDFALIDKLVEAYVDADASTQQAIKLLLHVED